MNAVDLSRLSIPEKRELGALLAEKERREGLKTRTVVGFVDPESGEHTHSLKRNRFGAWEESEETPDM